MAARSAQVLSPELPLLPPSSLTGTAILTAVTANNGVPAGGAAGIAAAFARIYLTIKNSGTDDVNVAPYVYDSVAPAWEETGSSYIVQGGVTISVSIDMTGGARVYLRATGDGSWSVDATGFEAPASGAGGAVTLAGDVSGPSGATVIGALKVTSAMIAAAAVTLAKMADMATASLIYRKTAGTGTPEVNTLATLKTDLALTGTNSGDQTITLTGDVTGSGTGSFAATLTIATILAKFAAGVSALAMNAQKITGLAAGTAAGDAVKCSQAGPSCIGWGNGAQGTYLTATTYTFDPWNSTLAATSTATGTKKFLCPIAGKLVAYWRISVNGMLNGTGAASAVVTLQKNGVDTAMTVTWTPSSAADTATLFGGGAIAVAAGDQLTLKMVPTLTGTAACVLTGLVFSGAITVA